MIAGWEGPMPFCLNDFFAAEKREWNCCEAINFAITVGRTDYAQPKTTCSKEQRVSK